MSKMSEAFKKAGIDQMIECPYCKGLAKLVTGREIYPHRKDLWTYFFYGCKPCGAYVGCHKGTTNPLGSPANAELRAIRSEAHRVFDPIWQEGDVTRGEAYAWPKMMSRKNAPIHIGQSSIEQCQWIIKVCNIHPHYGGGLL